MARRACGHRSRASRIIDGWLFGSITAPSSAEMALSLPIFASSLIPALSPHPVLRKWLYLRESSEAFESVAEDLVRLARQDDSRIGVTPRPRKRKRAYKGAAANRRPAMPLTMTDNLDIFTACHAHGPAVAELGHSAPAAHGYEPEGGEGRYPDGLDCRVIARRRRLAPRRVGRYCRGLRAPFALVQPTVRRTPGRLACGFTHPRQTASPPWAGSRTTRWPRPRW